MIHIPDQILIGTDKYESVLANQSVFSFDDKRLLRLAKLDGLNNLCYRPTKHSNQSVVSEEPGFVFYTYVIQKLMNEHKLRAGEPIVYIEHVGSHIYLLLIDAEGKVHSESLTEVLVDDDQIKVLFNSDGLELVLRRIAEFINTQSSIPRTFVSSSYTLDTERLFNASVTAIAQERLRHVRKINQTGLSLLFSLQDQKTDAAILETGVLSAPKHIEVPFACDTTPYLTDLIVSLLNSKEDILTTALLPSQFRTGPLKRYLKKKNLGRGLMGSLIALCVATITVPPYLENKREEERIKNRIITVKRQVDEFQVYRELITKEGLNAEMSLKQIALALGVFSTNREKLQWFPSEIQANTSNVSFTMTDIGGTSVGLSDFATQNGLVHFYNDNNQVLGYGLKRYAINDEVYRTPVDDEIRYIEDMVRYMFDYTEVSIAQRTSHENWTSALVSVEFNCWLPETIEYFSTQLYPRNYGFATLKAAWSDKADVNGTPLIPCGYSGTLQLEIYGHKGAGLSTTQTKDKSGQSENI